MAYWASFVGGFYKALSPTVGADTAINLYTETRDVPGSAKQVTLYGTPGLSLDGTVETTRCRGWFSQDGRTWVVVGFKLYERTAMGVYADRGEINDDGFPVSFATNGLGGDQLGIVGGGNLYVLNLTTNSLAPVSLPFVDPVMITFLDGYGLINQADTPIVWFSTLEDLETWDALDFFARSGTSDNIVGITVSQDRVWCFGTKTSTLFYNSGDADTPFVPYPGTTMQTGLVSPSLLGLYNDVVYWVAESSRGQRRVVRANEPTAQEISTPPITQFLANCTSLSDATMVIYEQDGHPFIVFTAPSSTDDVCSYAFDVRENTWHARAGWDSDQGRYIRWRVAGSTSDEGQVYVGDYETGALYTLDLDTYTDNGEVIRRERTTPYVSAENQWVFVDQVELGVQSGVGLSSGQGSAPLVNLEVSRDGARTFTSAGTATVGAQGVYDARAIWRRLGRSRSDRLVFRVTQTDPVKTVWAGAWVRFSEGTGQL